MVHYRTHSRVLQIFFFKDCKSVQRFVCGGTHLFNQRLGGGVSLVAAFSAAGAVQTAGVGDHVAELRSGGGAAFIQLTVEIQRTADSGAVHQAEKVFLSLSGAKVRLAQSCRIHIILYIGRQTGVVLNALFDHHTGVVGNISGGVDHNAVLAVYLSNGGHRNPVNVLVCTDDLQQSLHNLLAALLRPCGHRVHIAEPELLVAQCIANVGHANVKSENVHNRPPVINVACRSWYQCMLVPQWIEQPIGKQVSP